MIVIFFFLSHFLSFLLCLFSGFINGYLIITFYFYFYFYQTREEVKEFKVEVTCSYKLISMLFLGLHGKGFVWMHTLG